MTDISLEVRQGSLSEIEQALTAAHNKLQDQVDELMTKVDGALSGWGQETASRTAQVAYQRKLQESVKELATALDKVRATLSQVAEDAQSTETENVAAID